MPGGGSSGTGGTNSNQNDSSNPPLPAQFEAGGNWIVYVARIEQYFVAYNITDDNRKRGILLTSLSQDVYELLMDLCFPILPETKSFKEINEILTKQYKPAVSVYAERRKFYDAGQKQGESVADFLARLRGLTRHCKLGNSFNDVLRDKFVCGLLRGPLFNKAMELEPTADLEACVDAVIRKEATLGQGLSSSTESMHYVKSSSKSCYVCGDASHESKACKFKGYVCRSCNTKGHLAKVCKRKQNQTQDQTKQAGHHYVELDGDGHQDEDDDYDYGEAERITWPGGSS